MITNERNKERITFYPFFLAHWTFVNFFGLWTKYAGFFSYLYALPGYTEYTFFSKSNSPSSHPPTTSPPPPHRPPQKWSARTIVEFPTSHISFVTQHVLYVPVIHNYNISGQMHVLCIYKEFCHLCWINLNRWVVFTKN